MGGKERLCHRSPREALPVQSWTVRTRVVVSIGLKTVQGSEASDRGQERLRRRVTERRPCDEVGVTRELGTGKVVVEWRPERRS